MDNYKNKIANYLNSGIDDAAKELLLKLFPELQESEDETIRNWLIAYFHQYKEDGIEKYANGLKVESIITWLEKQGTKEVDSRYSILDKLIEADDIYQMSVNDAMVEEAKNKAIEALSKLEISKLLGFEKQGEQNPTDKVEPKFKVGDIVKSISQPMCEPRKIISIGKDCYWCEDRGCIGFAWEDDCELVEQKPAWKPSDEQLYWIKWVAHRLPDTEKANEAEAVLEELLEQLKKLKG